MELAKMEHQKAIDEINLRIEHVDAWFNNKFFLVGALFAGFLLFLEPSWKEARVSNRPFEKRLNYVLRSNATCSVLALACIVALAIDMHIRDELLLIRQLGLWIEGYIEPLLLGDPITATVKHNFLGWEQFLRVERGSAGGMHIDDLYGLLAVPHVHFLTWVLYILYIGTLHLTFSDREQTIETKAQYQIAFSFLVLLHTALLVFAISAHSAPSAFEFKVLPFTGWWGSGFVASGFWLIPWFVIVAVVSPLTCHVYSRARGLVPSDSHHDDQAGADGGHGTGSN